MRYVIEVKDLTKKFGSLVAVDGISFAVEPGEVFGLLGPNGAIKCSQPLCAGLLVPLSYLLNFHF